ncbi:MAG: hypothetical protein COZ20_01910 [Gallionellales bacterium CG_4_10_14_3_um_filter_54_96]|nr:MAG: hypothetical protein COW45_07475 [Gallionellales bacterium CG17_big_fil_post_rev_8_21_14_2_50_54_146]PIX05437.1 MAG: hypothetical protein COZ77_01205 [Gallionellales bacterium CG_4_8_14_3_um_filter_54_18]PIY06221.1 MAG: hypothetical protein COZ20_01910 [Gallionellales bacterium CG_4_10_14_3_um_filter_54_96]
MSKNTNATVATKTSYESSVITRAMGRAGNNPHLKGHIHEILTKDSMNLKNVFSGQHTELTKSTTAKAVDLVTTKGGKVISRIQVKDTISQSGIDKLVRQVADGKYQSTKLVGTEETTKLANAAFEKAGLSKRMVSSGTSSNTTTSLAQRAGASGSGTLGSAVGQAAKSGGAVGAGVGAGIEVVSGLVDLANGNRDVGEVTVAVAKAGAKGYATGASAGAAATVGGALAAEGLAAVGAGAAFTTAATFAAPVVAAVAVGYVVSEVWDWLFD